MTPALRTALRRLGYRHMGKEVWGKPIAYHILLVRIENEQPVVSNHFYGLHGPCVWEKQQLYFEDYHQATIPQCEDALRMVEWTTRTNVGQPGPHYKPLSFNSADDQYAELM